MTTRSPSKKPYGMTARLWEYKVIYTNNSHEWTGEHYYMCEDATQALKNHSIIAQSHDRLLPVSAVYKYCPYSEKWQDETSGVSELIDKLNER